MPNEVPGCLSRGSRFLTGFPDTLYVALQNTTLEPHDAEEAQNSLTTSRRHKPSFALSQYEAMRRICTDSCIKFAIQPDDTGLLLLNRAESHTEVRHPNHIYAPAHLHTVNRKPRVACGPQQYAADTPPPITLNSE